MPSTAKKEWIDDGLSMTITSATTPTVQDCTTSFALPSVRRSNQVHQPIDQYVPVVTH